MNKAKGKLILLWKLWIIVSQRKFVFFHFPDILQQLVQHLTLSRVVLQQNSKLQSIAVYHIAWDPDSLFIYKKDILSFLGYLFLFVLSTIFHGYALGSTLHCCTNSTNNVFVNKVDFNNSIIQWGKQKRQTIVWLSEFGLLINKQI